MLSLTAHPRKNDIMVIYAFYIIFNGKNSISYQMLEKTDGQGAQEAESGGGGRRQSQASDTGKAGQLHFKNDEEKKNRIQYHNGSFNTYFFMISLRRKVLNAKSLCYPSGLINE